MTQSATQTASPRAALPFALSLALIPLAWVGAVYGGWTVLLLPLATWALFSGLLKGLWINIWRKSGELISRSGNWGTEIPWKRP